MQIALPLYVAGYLVSFIAGSAFAPTVTMRSINENASEPIGSGMLGGLERQSDLTEAAARDSCDPPSCGELTEKRVASYIGVTAKTQALQERLSGTCAGPMANRQ